MTRKTPRERRSLNRWLVIALLLKLANVGLDAQTSSATLFGTVRDQSGGVVPGAIVTISNTGTNRVWKVQTNESGNYTAPLLNPGEYSVSVSREGFQTEVQNGIVLQVDQRAQIDATLKPGSTTELLQVTAVAPLLESKLSDPAVVGVDVSGRFVISLLSGHLGGVLGRGGGFGGGVPFGREPCGGVRFVGPVAMRLLLLAR